MNAVSIPNWHAGAVRDGRHAASITLDISRLLSRMRHPTPTGIDRVELAYARALLDRHERDVRFEAWVPGPGFLQYRRAAMAALLDALDRQWRGDGTNRMATAIRGWSGVQPKRVNAPDNVHLIVSHQHLAKLDRRRSRLSPGRVCVYLHDTIPSDYPEYARPGGASLHLRRLHNSIALADAIIVNSHSTAEALERHFDAVGRRPALLVAPLGIEEQFRPAAQAVPNEESCPYFVCVGTIEPRKNHLLLLHIWRALAERLSDATPRLVLVGRRGWENENIVDLLDRCPALRGKVIEASGMGDHDLARLMSGARAILMPSFAEGFGLPVAEALAAGVPVIASDIAVLREIGGDAPDYLNPLDGPGWTAAIRDYASAGSAMRAAQLERIKVWRAPRWDTHFRQVLPFLDAL